MHDFIGPHPIPDEVIGDYLIKMIADNEKILSKMMEQLWDTIKETADEEQPLEFAYAKLLNFLNAQNGPVLIYICAAALWKLWEENWNTNQNE